MKFLAISGVALFLMAGPALAAGLALPPKVQVSPLPGDAKPQSIELARAVVQLPDGKVWATESDWLTCGLLARKARWNAEVSELALARLKSAFEAELAGLGFNRQNVNLFEEGPKTIAFQAGALIKDMEAQFCGNYDVNPTTYNGKMRLTVEWQIYDLLNRQVVARIETTAGGEEKRRSVDGPEYVLLAAFRENVRALAANQDFRRVITSPPAVTGVGTASAGPTIALSSAAAPVGVPQASRSVATVFAGASMGSGFLVSSDGYVLTNHHVVGDSKYVKLKWADGTETLGEVVRSNARRDVALIKTDAKGRAPLSLRQGGVQQGETVFAIGTPLEEKLSNTMTKGIVSATRDYEGQPFIQSDVGVTHGNSGGPLIDEKGAVIGLTVIGLHADQSKSLNLFIPIGEALKALALQPTS